MRRLVLLFLLALPEVSCAASPERIAPTISLPKRLDWGMSFSTCREILKRQGLQLSEREALVAPRWYGQLGWTRAFGVWQSDAASRHASPAEVRGYYYFGPDDRIQHIEIRCEASPENLDAGLLAFARAAHTALSAKYGTCRTVQLKGHSCKWEDELGYGARFVFERNGAGAYDIGISYSSPAWKRALEDQDEF